MTIAQFIHHGRITAVLFATAIAFVAKAAPSGPPQALFDQANPRVLEAMAVQNAITPDLMTIDGILGTAVGLDDLGQLSIIVFVNEEHANRNNIVQALPRNVRGILMSAHLTEPFHALVGKPGSGSSHTAKQTPPIQLGTSGGWSLDLANGYCCGGTLGSLIQVNGTQYIMSNYHVFESDIVAGGNNLVAETGDSVIQPGLIDVSCNASRAQGVGTLRKLSSLPDSNVDVSVAQVTESMVRSDGAILEIGTLSSSTVAASLKQPVKKSGRSSGLTRSTIAGLNATISVTYDNECAGGTAFTKTFTGQIVISNRNGGKQFLIAGDSGSLMVEDVSTNPRAVGLLYAGSSTYAIANPIFDVLSFISSQIGAPATMVGQ